MDVFSWVPSLELGLGQGSPTFVTERAGVTWKMP